MVFTLDIILNPAEMEFGIELNKKEVKVYSLMG